MSTNKNNNIFEKTSFLGNNSSEFVEALYSDYLSDPSKIPDEWRKFFQGLNEKSGDGNYDPNTNEFIPAEKENTNTETSK